MKYQGLDRNNNPIFTQKQVDMLLGLDVAYISFNKHVDRILILSADTDMIPVMKTAIIHGIQVIFSFCPDIQREIDRKLKEHADFIREVTFQDIFLNS